MLAVSDGKYELPVKQTSPDGEVFWLLRNKEHNDIMRAKRFNFTLLAGADAESDRMTFTYDGNSVKPTARTLRKHGAAKLQPIVSKLSAQHVVKAKEEKQDDNSESQAAQIIDAAKKVKATLWKDN